MKDKEEIKLCKWCGNVISSTTPHAVFCCKQCEISFKKANTVHVQCFYCNKILTPINNNNTNVIGYVCKHCANEKFGKHIGPNGCLRVLKRCEYCGELFVCDNCGDIKHNHRFCCRDHSSKYAKKTGCNKIPECDRERVTKICDYCGKEYKVHMYRADTSHYCSKKCHYADGVKWLTCKCCGTQYKEEKNILKTSFIRQKFCPNCRNLKTTSAFELDVYDWLVEQFGDIVQRNQKIKKDINCTHGKYIFPDIKIDNMVIECNGDYFHCNPKFYDKTFINNTTRLTAEQTWKKDHQKLGIYAAHGLKCITIWEDDWKNNNKLTKNNLFNEIEQNLKNNKM